MNFDRGSTRKMAAAKAPPKKRRRIEGRPGRSKLEVVASQPSLALLPDSVALRILALLDIPSLLRLSRVNRRYHLLHTDEFIWTDVDLSTVPRLDVQKVKRVIRERLHPALWRLILRSNAVECQRKPRLRPTITSSAMDELFRKCPNIRDIRLHNFDLVQVPESCLLWSSSTLERVTLSHCIAPFRWLEAVKPHWPRLTLLSLPYTTKTSDHDLAYMASRKDDWGLSLRHIDMKKCYRVGKDGIKYLCDSFPKLITLDVSQCNGLNSECLDLVAKHMTCLRHLNIAESVQVDSVEDADELLTKLQTNCSHLRQLVVSAAQLHLDEDMCSESNAARVGHLRYGINSVDSCMHTNVVHDSAREPDRTES